MNNDLLEALKEINDVINQPNYTDSLPARYSNIKTIATEAIKTWEDERLTKDEFNLLKELLTYAPNHVDSSQKEQLSKQLLKKLQWIFGTK